MKISVMSNSLVNVIFSLFYIEPFCFVTIDRGKVDITDTLTWNANNCNRVYQTFSEHGRCKCSITPSSTILSTETGQVACIENGNINEGK